MGKKLYKINEGKLLCGVCAGLAEYLRMDVGLVRILWSLLTLFFLGLGIVIYILAALLLPFKDEL